MVGEWQLLLVCGVRMCSFAAETADLGGCLSCRPGFVELVLWQKLRKSVFDRRDLLIFGVYLPF